MPSTKQQHGPPIKEAVMARKRFQSGMLTKEGKRRKVWVVRWRENVLSDDGVVRRVRRSQVIGTVTELPTRRDAQNKVEERLRPINAGTSKPESSMSFGSFVETQWKVLALPNFKASTQHGYKTVLVKHVLPEWKSWRLRDIERLAVQQWVGAKFRQGAGWQVVRNSWTVLSSALESAVEFGYLEGNPARGVKFPQKALKRKPTIIAGADFVKLLSRLSEPYNTMVSLIAATGLRVGELLALRWGAVDLQTGTLSVRESVFEGTFSSPKTQRAFRTLPIGPRIVKALTDHRERVERKGPDDLLFGNRLGKPLGESKVLQRVLQPAAAAAGLGRVTWHQFRHIHSSLLNDLRVPAKIAQEQLGHSAITTTLGIYTHVVEASHRSAVEAVEARLFELDGTGRKLPERPVPLPPASSTVH
jgi:integrase